MNQPTFYEQKVLFYLLVLKQIEIFLFPIVKMAANYARIDKVGNLDAGFKQVKLV